MRTGWPSQAIQRHLSLPLPLPRRRTGAGREAAREPQRQQGEDRHRADRPLQALELGFAVVVRDRLGLVSRDVRVHQCPLGLLNRDDRDAGLGGLRDALADLQVDRRVVLDPSRESARQRRDQHGADQRRAERGAKVLGGPLETAGLVRLRRVDRRHDHVAELGEQQAGADAEDGQRHGELRLAELHVDRPEQEQGGGDEGQQTRLRHALRGEPRRQPRPRQLQ